jgi:hypothetical protein
MWLLLVWSGGLLRDYGSGLEFHAEPARAAALLLLAGMFGLILPLQAAAIARGRSAAGMAGGAAGTLFGLLSISCCAPLVVPALLSFAGFSGTAILSLNTALSGLETPLTLAAVLLMLLSLVLVTRTLTAACQLPPR